MNEGPASTEKHPIFNTLFPSPSANSGSSQIFPSQELSIPENGAFIFDRHRGTEKLWVVWSKEMLPEFEALKKWVNVGDRGNIGDQKQAQYLQSFLAKSVPFSVESRGDDENHGTTLNGMGEIFVHLVNLDHE